jgi:para-aminobenzoate synthetase component 1
LNKINILDQISLLDKPYIIYRSKNGFTLYTNFSKKIILTKKNISSFLKKTDQKKKRIKKTDLYVGFFGYELLNDLIKVKIPKQKKQIFQREYL